MVGAAVLLGTGAGIAFFMLLAHRTGDAAIVAAVARVVVIADLLFTATAVVLPMESVELISMSCLKTSCASWRVAGSMAVGCA